MRLSLRRLAAPVLLAVLAGAAGVAVAESPENALKYRQDVMRAMGGHFGAVALITKGAVPNKADLAAHAAALRDLTGMIAGAFKTKTTGGKTLAKPAIWSHMADFDKKARDAHAAAAKLADVAASNGDAGAAWKNLLEACKACHKDYRAQKK